MEEDRVTYTIRWKSRVPTTVRKSLLLSKISTRFSGKAKKGLRTLSLLDEEFSSHLINE